MCSVYDVLPLRLCADMVSDCTTPRKTMWFDSARPTWDIKFFFTFYTNRDKSVLELFHVVVFQWKTFSLLTQAIETVSKIVWIAVERSKMTSISIHIIANQSSYHDDKSTLQCFTRVFCPKLIRNVRSRRRIDSSIIAYPVNSELHLQTWKRSLKCFAKNSTWRSC